MAFSFRFCGSKIRSQQSIKNVFRVQLSHIAIENDKKKIRHKYDIERERFLLRQYNITLTTHSVTLIDKEKINKSFLYFKGQLLLSHFEAI